MTDYSYEPSPEEAAWYARIDAQNAARRRVVKCGVAATDVQDLLVSLLCEPAQSVADRMYQAGLVRGAK